MNFLSRFKWHTETGAVLSERVKATPSRSVCLCICGLRDIRWAHCQMRWIRVKCLMRVKYQNIIITMDRIVLVFLSVWLFVFSCCVLIGYYANKKCAHIKDPTPNSGSQKLRCQATLALRGYNSRTHWTKGLLNIEVYEAKLRCTNKRDWALLFVPLLVDWKAHCNCLYSFVPLAKNACTLYTQ